MRKRRLFLMLIAGVALVGLIAVVFRSREPEYRGKRLSEWVETGWSRSSFGTDRLSKESGEAGRHIGTNALPYLLEWIRYEPSGWRNGVRNAVNWMLEKANFSKRFRDRKAIRAGGTVAVFATLGPEARAAVPELSQISRDFNAR